MIEKFTQAWFANLPQMREKFTHKHPDSYKEVVRSVIEMLSFAILNGDVPDPEQIHEINDGEYQGTLTYVIAAKGYQPYPYRYWCVQVNYGSCSECDTLQAISFCDDEPPTDTQISKYMTLALHILQGLREMGGSDV